MNLMAIARGVIAVSSAISGAQPVIESIADLAASFKKVGDDLEKMPNNPKTGQPYSLAEAQAYLNQKVAESNRQSVTIRSNAQQALEENRRMQAEETDDPLPPLNPPIPT
jgi:hypothetical protein